MDFNNSTRLDESDDSFNQIRTMRLSFKTCDVFCDTSFKSSYNSFESKNNNSCKSSYKLNVDLDESTTKCKLSSSCKYKNRPSTHHNVYRFSLTVLIIASLLNVPVSVNSQPQFYNYQSSSSTSSNSGSVICPLNCSCSGQEIKQEFKQFTNCINSNYTSLPSIGLNPKTHVLKFDNNTLNFLPSRLFVDHNLLQLQHLFLSNCQIRTIADQAFFQLNNLIELDLSYNHLNYFPSAALQPLSKLKRIQLSGNPIKQMKENDFSSSLFNHLTHLEVSNAQLESIEDLKTLKKLELLDLSSNNLNQLAEDLFCPLTNLKKLNLANNQLTNFKSLGLSAVYHVTGHLCLQELQYLDLSFNQITYLTETGLASLKNLRELNLKNNQITDINEISLSTLNHLQSIDLSNNQISSIPSQLFRSSGELKSLHLQNNSISVLSPGLFTGLSKLSQLNLSHNEISNEHISSDTFLDLTRVVVLDLSFNRLRRINSTMFQSQYKVQILNLNDNQIESIEDNTFSSFYNLHTLVLSNNRIKSLNDFTLNGLFVLTKLYLNDNELTQLADNSLKNCSTLLELYMQNNLLRSLPTALNVLRSLKILNLSSNIIYEIRNASFFGLIHLEEINLSKNQITNLTIGSLRDLLNLKVLDLSDNRILNLEYGVFHDAPSLNEIYLQKNQLSDINGQFMKLASLRKLNVSNNQITWFDYALIPEELIYLDLNHNQIKALGNQSPQRTVSLQYLDLSSNLIDLINQALIPNSIRHLDLSSNKITTIHPITFVHKSNLTSVNLRGNLLQTIDVNALRVHQQLTTYQPEFLLADNPYSCSCGLEWLKGINSMEHTVQYPKVLDLNEINCELPFFKQSSIAPLTKVNSSNFLCTYRSHCYALCTCCDFDACDCQMICPDQCSCYYDSTWNTNIVDCSADGGSASSTALNLDANSISGYLHSTIPARIPMDVTELYLDGNNLNTLQSHTFIGRRNMRNLYLNSSNIHVISNKTFNGLNLLTSLHLENNFIKELNGYEFDSLENLRELYLQHNRISVIHNRTFTPLRSLRVLRLDYNLLFDYSAFFQLSNYNSKLNALYLADNNWPCSCSILMQMQLVMIHVKDIRNLKCISTDSRTLANNHHFVIDYVTTSCNQAGDFFTNNNNNQQSANPSVDRIPVDPNYDLKQITNNNGDSVSNEIENNPMLSNGGYYSRINQNSSPQSNLNDYNRSISVFVEHLPVFLLIVVISVFIIFGILLCIFRKDICVWAYSSFGIRLFQRTSNLGYPRHVERLYDAFVSFTSQDKDFVNTIVNNLEHGQTPYRLSINYRDVPVAIYEKEAIQKFIESSHRTIIVLSPHYIRSENCMYELKIALHHSVESHGAHQLIIIEMDKQLNPSDYYVYDDLNAALSSPYTTRISVDEKRFWNHMRYAMPAARLNTPYDYHHSTLTMNSTTLHTNTNIYNKFGTTFNNNTLRTVGPYSTSICDYSKRALPTNV